MGKNKSDYRTEKYMAIDEIMQLDDEGRRREKLILKERKRGKENIFSWVLS